MGLVVGHVVKRINNDSAGTYFAFKVAYGAICVSYSTAGYVMRPLAEFTNDGADAVVVADQGRSMLRCGYVMAANAVIGNRKRSCRPEAVDTSGTAGGVACGTVVADKVSIGQRKKRSKIWVMALNAPVSR
jgi:hypothetical protein